MSDANDAAVFYARYYSPPPTTPERARLTLAQRALLSGAIAPDGGLDTLRGYSSLPYTSYSVGSGNVTLDGVFTPEELEAIAAYIRETEQ